MSKNVLGLNARERRLIYALGAALLGLLYHYMGGEMPGNEPVSDPVVSDMAPYAGKVVGVHDGDTLTVLDEQKQTHKIRMAQIDAPELAQPFGQDAKKMLSNIVYNQSINVLPDEKDRYGRTVATVEVSGTDVNRQMVAQGGAWVYRNYLKDKSLIDVEAQARAGGRGLWALQEDQRQAPWEFRKKEREAKK